MKRKYTVQFKENAIALSDQKGNSSEAARLLGIPPSVLRRWRREKSKYAHNSFPGHGKPKLTDDQREISELKKALKDAQLEAEILKKAIGIFSVSDRKNTSL